MLRIYNTLTRKKEEFQTLEPGKVRMYVCGVTVYNDAHVGHAMSAVVYDIIRRYLEYRGYSVRHVMNFTDVDDKIINRSKQLGEDPFKLAQRYIDDYQKNLVDLNILPATSNPRATQSMDEIQSMIKGLIDRGFAYPSVNGDVYFRVTKDAEYGKLSGRRLEDMQAGSRIEIEAEKEHPMDFALWKSSKPGEPAWDSPWGPGRPGWHIECSAMSIKYLGEGFDIHGGGRDLIFPHHENEIAQAEGAMDGPFVRFWMHNGMLNLSEQKMSKSVGNILTLRDTLDQHRPEALITVFLASHYRSPMEFGSEVLEEAEQQVDRLRNVFGGLADRAAAAGASDGPGAAATR